MKTLLKISLLVVVGATLTLSQAQAGFIETFESGYTDGALLSADANWVAGLAQDFTGSDQFRTVNGMGHNGSGGDGGFGAYNGSGVISGGPGRAHGESTTPGSTLIAEFDYKPTVEEARFGFVNLAGSYVGVILVNSGVGGRFQSGGGAEPSFVVDSGTFNIVSGDWHKVTFSHEVDGPNTATTVDVLNYSTGLMYSVHPSVAIFPNTGNLHSFAIAGTDPGGTQIDNITVSGVVPEPTSAILLALGLLTLLGSGRRSNR
jgi:hypothetical protein